MTYMLAPEDVTRCRAISMRYNDRIKSIALALGINDASFITMPAVFADKTVKPRVVVTMRPFAMIDLRGEIS